MGIDKVDKGKEETNLQSKKQVRRRIQTSKPYKDRFLNMAEARREIATALKFHRASMNQQKSAANYHHLPPPATTTTAANGYLGSYSGYPFPPPVPHHWSIPPPVPPPPPVHYENLNLVLPKQTLGLNLNIQDFIYQTPMAVYSSSSASSSPSTSSSAAKEVAAVVNSCGGPEEDRKGGSHEDDDGYHPFDQVMEFPPWLITANESYDHRFSDEYSPDPALPCMDIGEIEGIDEEWLA